MYARNTIMDNTGMVILNKRLPFFDNSEQNAYCLRLVHKQHSKQTKTYNINNIDIHMP